MISRDISALISGIAGDIQVSAFFKGVIPGYPHISMPRVCSKLLIPGSCMLNSALSNLDKLIEALFFICCPLPGLEAAGLCKAP